MKWRSIKVPEEIYTKVSELSRDRNVAMWKVIFDSMSLAETVQKKPRLKEKLPAVDKVAWYVEKVAMSVGAFKENPNEQNLQRLLKTCSQITNRLGISTELLGRCALDYMNKKDKDTTIRLNMALKSLIIDIISKLPEMEEESLEIEE